MAATTLIALLVAVAASVGALVAWRRLGVARSEAERLHRAVKFEQAAVREAEREREQLLQAVDGIAVGAIALGPDGDVLFANRAAARFVDARHGDAVAEMVIHRLGREAGMSGEVVEEEVEVRSAGNTHFSIQAVPVSDVDGVAALIFVENITRQRLVDAVRRDFVANVSHELKTPLGALSLLAETVADEADPEVRRRLSSRMADEARRMGRLVDDVLTLSQIESEASGAEPLDLRTVVQAAADRIAVVAAERGVALEIDLPDDPVDIVGDVGQLDSVVVNLIENAVKYTAVAERPDGGAVRVSVVRTSEETMLTVADDGIGMAKEHLDRVFERFYRIDRGRSRETGGTGLGLAIVRHIVLNHGGTVTVDSQPGSGSVFTVRIPVDLDRGSTERAEVGESL